MRKKPVILTVEDDPSLQAVLSAYLELAGFTVIAAMDARQFHALFPKTEPDLVLLDLELPDEDGLVLARQLRAKSALPIIMVTGRKEREERIAGLEFGANDYVVKPFDPRELSLRIWNVLNMTSGGHWSRRAAGQGNCFFFAGLTLDCDQRLLLDSQGREIHLSYSEFELLHILVTRAGRVQSREVLLDGLTHSTEESSDRAVDVLISRLRKKLKFHGQQGVIVTVAGVGYRLAVPVEG